MHGTMNLRSIRLSFEKLLSLKADVTGLLRVTLTYLNVNGKIFLHF